MQLRGLTLVVATMALIGPAGVEGQAAPRDTLRSDQEAVQIRGEVADLTNKRPIPSAAIEVFDLENDQALAWRGLSDSTGIFLGPRLLPSTYRLNVDALGYRPATQILSLSGYGVVDLQVELGPEALELEPLIVVSRRRSRLETAGFYDRRTRGFGHSLTREEIEARNVLQVTDLVRAMPGVTVSPGSFGSGGLVRLRGGCVPDVVLDGVRMSPPVRLDDILSVADLEGIEVYSGATSPIEFSRSTCGTVLAWTRDPGTTSGDPWSWKKAGAAAGFLLLGIFLVG